MCPDGVSIYASPCSSSPNDITGSGSAPAGQLMLRLAVTFFLASSYFKAQIRQWIDQFGVTSEDLKNLSISAVLGKMLKETGENGTRSKLQSLLGAAERFGMQDEKAGEVIERLTR